MTELDVNLPSIRQTQGLIKDKIGVEIKLLTNDTFTGRIVWQDTQCLFIVDASEQKILIYRHAIAFIKPQG
jgi:host factor-I protein